MSALLETRQLKARYGRANVLQGIDLRIEQGCIVALLGANGAGKTTMLRSLSNMMVQLEGEVLFDGARIDALSTENIARRGIAHVPDDRGTFGGLTVEENLTLGACTRRDRSGVRRDFERVYGYFPKLSDRRGQQAGTLSGGEQQMLAISRALMLQPRLLLLDEPSFGLAPIIAGQIFEILRLINREERVTMLLVEQNAKVALNLASYAYLMETGRIVMEGSAADVSSDENVRRAYLGY
jgi:branched-chain amino acid transport system ATP-binding protein